MSRVMSVQDLIGEPLTAEDPYGQDMQGDLIDGYIPDRSLVHIGQAQIGDGLAGPINDQQLQIFRDVRPIAADELGMQGPFNLEISKYARHRAGRTFPLNYEWVMEAPALTGLVPEQDTRAGAPYSPGMLPPWHDGFTPVEVLPNPNTVFYTASPAVGWEGY